MRLIDADALKAVFEEKSSEAVCGVELCKAIISRIDEAQTVDAEHVRHGKWLPKHHYIAGHEFVSGHICSECGDDAMNAEGDEFVTDYCPWCGARMDVYEKQHSQETDL